MSIAQSVRLASNAALDATFWTELPSLCSAGANVALSYRYRLEVEVLLKLRCQLKLRPVAWGLARKTSQHCHAVENLIRYPRYAPKLADSATIRSAPSQWSPNRTSQALTVILSPILYPHPSCKPRSFAVGCSDATVYIPAAFRMANIMGDIPFFYSRILHDAMQFDALIALVITVQRIHLAINDRMSPTILQHVGLATTALRKRLLSGKDITSDAVFCTMFRLLIVQVWNAFNSFWGSLTYPALCGQCRGT